MKKGDLNFTSVKTTLSGSTVFLFLVSHLRLGQRLDDPAVGWHKPFYCHYTFPSTAFQLVYTLKSCNVTVANHSSTGFVKLFTKNMFLSPNEVLGWNN